MKIKINILGKQGEGKSTVANALVEFFETHYFKGLNGTVILVEENNPDIDPADPCNVVITVRQIT